MSIITNFLKLVKPEKNDYVDVEEHISNNLDKIDEKMENFNLNKLDKGGYTGTAQNLLTEISKIASKTVLGRMIVGKGLTVDSSGRTSVVSKNDGIIVNDNNIQLNVYDGVDSSSTTRAGSAKAVKAAYDKANNALPKTGGAVNGWIQIVDGKLEIKRDGYPEVAFINSNNESDRGAVGYAVAGEYAYLRGGSINGYTNAVELHDDGTSKYPAKNLNTKNKEVVQAINELYSDFRYLGSALSVNAVVSFSEYREYLIFGRYSAGSYCGFYYLDSTMLSALPIKTLSFYSSTLEGSFTIDASNKRFKVTNVGDGNGGIDVFAR